MLPELQQALEQGLTVYIVEGEKVADLMWSLNLPATTNAGGAGKWSPALTPYFANADVIVIGDYDPQKTNPKTNEPMFHLDGRPILPGQDHALDVARELSDVAARVRVLDLALVWRDIKPKNDFYDWYQDAKQRSSDPVAEFNLLIERAVDWSSELTLEYPGAIAVAGPTDFTPRYAGSLDEWDAGDDPGPIPPRQWLLGNQFCRGFISSIVAAGGAGKTALRLLQFIAMATGRPLSGQTIFRRCRVLLISLEDDRDELQRRIKAVLDYYGIDRKELKDWLFCASPKLVKLAMLDGKNRRVTGPLEQFIRDAIKRRNPDIVSLDPFIKTHALEENDSGDMDFVCDLLARIAIEFNVAVDSPHHVHKGSVEPGNADAGRGSSGIRDAGRLVYTLAPMSDAEARTFNIALEDRYSYVRLDPAKVNIAARSTKTTWFKIEGQSIDNGTDEYPNGDTVQVVEPWSPPDTWGDTTIEGLNRVLDEIDRGLENGQRYSNAPAATDRQVWPVIQKVYPDKPEGSCRAIISAWLDSGLIYPRDYDDPLQRKVRKGLYVDATKRPGPATFE
jgi:hypothetical protein